MIHRECIDRGTGKVLHHTLTEDGNIEFYNIEWPDGVIEENIPANLLELTVVQEHKHGPKKKKKKIDESKKKKNKSKVRKGKLGTGTTGPDTGTKVIPPKKGKGSKYKRHGKHDSGISIT